MCRGLMASCQPLCTLDCSDPPRLWLPASAVPVPRDTIGDPNMSGDLHDLTINHRQLCGEGSFDIAGFLKCMRDIGYDGPYGIEVLSEKLRPLTLDETTKRVYDTTIAQFRSL